MTNNVVISGANVDWPCDEKLNWKKYFSQPLPKSPDKAIENVQNYREALRLLKERYKNRKRKLNETLAKQSLSTTTGSTIGSNATATKKLFPIFEKGFSPKMCSSPIAKAKGKVTKPKMTLKSNEQYAIDAGQKNFDGVTCKTCHMVYTPGEISDEQHHAQYHDTFQNGVKFLGWKNERIVNVTANGRIIAVLASDKKNMLKKVDDLFSVADLELGIRVPVKECLKDSSMFLIYVASNHKRVAGFLAAEAIHEAFKLVREEPMQISSTPSPASVGVARLWVHPHYRRQGIATALLDTLRCNFRFDREIDRRQVAFSDPTNEGRAFAQRYVGDKEFLVFRYGANTPLAQVNLNKRTIKI